MGSVITSAIARRKIFRTFFQSLLLIPVLIPLIFVILIPGLRTILMSFQRVTFGAPVEFVGLRNFVEIFSDPFFKNVLLNNVIYAFFTVGAQILVGLLAAVLISSTRRIEKLLIGILMMPYAVSPVVAIIIWKYILEPDLGIVNYVLHTILGLGQIEWASNPIQAWIVIILIETWLGFPFSFLIIYSAVIGVSQELYDSAHIDGAGPWQAFRFVTIPVITPAIMVAMMFGFIFSFRGFATVWILTKGGPMRATELLAIVLYKHAYRFWEFGTASAVALVLTILTFLLAIGYLRKMYRRMFVD